MPIDPRLAPLVAALAAEPRPQWVDAADRRAQLAARTSGGNPYAGYVEPPPELAEVRDEGVPVTGPAGRIGVRIYRPADRGGASGALVYYHGGGWWAGSPADSEARCRTVAAGAGVVVVSVDYRLAPEHPFPVPVEDAYQALQWTVGQAGRLGVAPDRIGVGGESAGGNLAAAVALLARDRDGPALRLQLLEIPALDLTLSSPSVARYGGVVLPADDLRWCVDTYLAGHPPTDPVASPLLATDLTGLPPAAIMTAECDPLSDDGRRYAARLADAGVPATFQEYAGHVHGSHTLTALLPSAREWRAAVVAAVRDRLTAPLPHPH